ncbi:MAG TPA: hypothetical protein VGD40_10885 [Chryseosolibacter sp.]
MKRIIFIAIGLAIISCNRGYQAKETLSPERYDETLAQLAPYIIAKSDEFSFEQRFLPENKPFYDNFISLTGGELVYFQEVDTASLFFFQYRDLTSLYEHYRGIGGYFRTDENGKITFVNLLYHTPRLTSQEILERRKFLFEEMMTKGNVQAYLGNKKFIHTPNNDFYYDTKLSRWEFTENSSWKFLKEAREQADSNSLR